MRYIRLIRTYLDIQTVMLIGLDFFLFYALIKIVYTLTQFLIDFIPKLTA